MKDPSLNSDRHGIDKLTPDILKKYQEGKLTRQEMHLVEKMLLDDPFAAEALEGMESLNDTARLESIEAGLNLQVADRIGKGKAKVIPIYQRPWNIAAALVLLFVASYLLFNNTDLLNPSASRSQGPIALEKPAEPERSGEKEEQKSVERKKEPVPVIKGDSILGEDQSQREQQSDGEAIQDFQAQSLKGERAVSQITSPADKESGLVAIEKDEEITTDLDIDSDANPDLAQNAGAITESKAVRPEKARKKDAQAPVAEEPVERAFSRTTKKASELLIEETASRLNDQTGFPKTISGQVISAEDGQGLPGVTLSIKGSNKGVHTDNNGNYKLSVNESDSILTYSFIGYETEEVIIREQENIDVALEPDNMALEEIVVVAYGNEGEKEAFIPVVSALPEGGHSDYKRYLKDNLRYPSNALDNEIEGKVKVTFFVQSDGRLSDFEVKKGLGYGCDEEVIRLIKEGPDWQPAKKGETQIKQKVRVKVKFKLDK